MKWVCEEWWLKCVGVGLDEQVLWGGGDRVGKNVGRGVVEWV